jgi:hypothetical protein
VGQLQLTINPAEATVEVDTRARRAGLVYLSPGAHELKVSAPAYTANTQIVAIAAGQSKDLTVTLEKVRPDKGKGKKGPKPGPDAGPIPKPKPRDPIKACQRLVAACQAAGYAQGKGLYRICVFPLFGGEDVKGVIYDVNDLEACQTLGTDAFKGLKAPAPDHAR